jgi:hypothetical protein
VPVCVAFSLKHLDRHKLHSASPVTRSTRLTGRDSSSRLTSRFLPCPFLHPPSQPLTPRSHFNPGGYLEIVDSIFPLRSDDNT